MDITVPLLVVLIVLAAITSISCLMERRREARRLRSGQPKAIRKGGRYAAFRTKTFFLIASALMIGMMIAGSMNEQNSAETASDNVRMFAGHGGDNDGSLEEAGDDYDATAFAQGAVDDLDAYAGDLSSDSSTSGDVFVHGYDRADGTHVDDHYRSAPNDTRSDNWSAAGNVNPHTGAMGTK